MPDRRSDLDAALDERWSSRLDEEKVPKDWFGVRVRQLLTAASTTPLWRLFPYTSVNTLHFSRCSAWPFTYDCPWVFFHVEQHFVTYAPDPLGRPGNCVWPLPPVLLETDDQVAAVEAVVRALAPAGRGHLSVGRQRLLVAPAPACGARPDRTR
jgi:hypothetical protein